MSPQAHAFAPAQGVSSGSERPPGPHVQQVPVRAAASAAPAEGSSAGPAAHALPIAGQPVAGTASVDPPQPAQALPVTIPAALPQREGAASILQSGELAERALHEHTAP